MRARVTLTQLIIMLVLIPTVSIAWMGAGFGTGRSIHGGSFEDGMFWGADLDRNERLDRDEAMNVYNLANDEIFERYDKDKNGTINRIEFFEFIQQSPWTDKFIHPKDME